MRLPARNGRLATFHRIVGTSLSISNVRQQARRAAEVDSSVLILGEKGTGRRLLAEQIHQNSRRRNGPFVCVRTASIPQRLIEETLFGRVGDPHVDAAQEVGRLRAADGGTVFLDDVARLGKTVQAKLLCLLERRRITPVNACREVGVDVRLIAATTRDLDALARQGDFRRDLYSDLALIPIVMPPLRARREDIPALVRHFLDRIRKHYLSHALRLQSELIPILKSYDWPGNVAELRTCVESLAADARTGSLCDGRPASEPDGQTYPCCGPGRGTLAAAEQRAVVQALRQSGGNRSRAARMLGISVRTLQRKLRRWGQQDAPRP